MARLGDGGVTVIADGGRRTFGSGEEIEGVPAPNPNPPAPSS